MPPKVSCSKKIPAVTTIAPNAKAPTRKSGYGHGKVNFCPCPKTVVEHLGRYTHKVAISNHRLLQVNDQTVSFAYKDYEDGKKKAMTISGIAFLRRFAHHVLPFGFVRTRHYGFLASKNKPIELNQAKESLGQVKWEKQNYSWQQLATEKLGYDPGCCPQCKENNLVVIQVISPERAPPNYMDRW